MAVIRLLLRVMYTILLCLGVHVVIIASPHKTVAPLQKIALFAIGFYSESQDNTSIIKIKLIKAVQPQLQKGNCFDNYYFARPIGSPFTRVTERGIPNKVYYVPALVIADKVETITRARLGYSTPKSPSY